MYQIQRLLQREVSHQNAEFTKTINLVAVPQLLAFQPDYESKKSEQNSKSSLLNREKPEKDPWSGHPRALSTATPSRRAASGAQRTSFSEPNT